MRCSSSIQWMVLCVLPLVAGCGSGDTAGARAGTGGLGGAGGTSTGGAGTGGEGQGGEPTGGGTGGGTTGGAGPTGGGGTATGGSASGGVAAEAGRDGAGEIAGTAGTSGESAGGAGGGGTAPTGGSAGATLTGGAGGAGGAGGGAAVPFTLHLEAECTHGPAVGDCAGDPALQSGTVLETLDTTVGYFEGGDWLRFDAIDLTGADTLRFPYSKGLDGGAGTLEVRLDSPTGTVIATFAPSVTGAWTTWADATLPLLSTPGTHDLYLVAAGSALSGLMNFDWIEVEGVRPATGGTGGTGGTPGCGALDTSVDGAVSQELFLNHIGFDTGGPKQAVVEATGSLQTYQVVRGADTVVSCGTLRAVSGFSAWGGGPSYYTADFSDLNTAGTYRLHVNGEFSPYFTVADTAIFDATVADVVSYFRLSRADDSLYYNADDTIPKYPGTGAYDVRGGWYDASGDVSKYLSHLSYANYLNPQQIPLVAWALAFSHDEGAGALTAAGQLAAVRDEALWGADYLVRAQDTGGYFYINVFDGWTGSTSARQICAFSGSTGVKSAAYQAAFREGGGMAIAALARIARWNVASPHALGRTPTEYLDAAEAGFAHLQANGPSYCDDGVENVIDHYTALLAATELYITTNDATYLAAARSRATALISFLHPTAGYFIADGTYASGARRPFWHASDAGLPVVALARYADAESDATSRATAIAAIETHLDYLIGVTNAVANPFGYARQTFVSQSTVQAGFFIPHDNESGYWWQGENARLGSLAAAAIIGGRKVYPTSTGPYRVPSALATYAANQVDWIVGKNPYDVSFLNGAGRNNPPAYEDDPRAPYHGTLAGGIANGITGSGTNGSGITYNPAFGVGQTWQNWRWVEQWLPHSAWFLIATTAMAE